MTDLSQAPRSNQGVDAILREASREFDAPIALVAPDHGRDGIARAYASAPVRSPSGAPLGTLCILGPPRARGANVARLADLADRIAAALSA